VCVRVCVIVCVCVCVFPACGSRQRVSRSLCIGIFWCIGFFYQSVGLCICIDYRSPSRCVPRRRVFSQVSRRKSLPDDFLDPTCPVYKCKETLHIHVNKETPHIHVNEKTLHNEETLHIHVNEEILHIHVNEDTLHM